MTAPQIPAATRRSRARYKRADDIIGAVTLDAAHARALAAILARTGETRAACVRRLILAEAAELGVARPP